MSTTIPNDSSPAPRAPSPAPRTLASGCLTVLSWGLLGLLVGTGSGYFVYVKKPAEFQSSALLQVTAGEPASSADALVILSDPVLTAAVRQGRLDRLPGLQPPASNRALTSTEFVALLRQRAKLRVEPLDTHSSGAIYELYCHGATPSTAETVTAAIVSAYLDFFSNQGEQADWQAAMQLLQTTRSEGLARIAELEQQREQRRVPVDASLQNDTVMSAAAEQWSRLQSESERLHNAYIQATASLRQTESLIADGATADQVLAALGNSTKTNRSPTPAPMPIPDPQPDADALAAARTAEAAARAAEQRRNIMAERKRIRDEVERDLQPLQQERDRLLKIVASEHPKVRGVETRMQKVRERLQDLPPLPPAAEPAIANAPGPRDAAPLAPLLDDASPPNDADIPLASPGAQITSQLRALRQRRDELSRQMTDIDARLDQATQLVSQQKSELQEDARIRREIQVQQRLVERAIEQLAEIPAVPPAPQARAQVLRSPQPGVQVAPWVWSHVLVGALAGLLSGIVLAGLVLLTAGAASEPPASPN